MADHHVVLTEHQEQLINRLVSSGRYQNVSEVLRAGLRLVEQEEAALAGLKARIAAGLRQARAAAFAEGDGPSAVRRAFQVARERIG